MQLCQRVRTDMIRYSLPNIFDKIRKFAWFNQIYTDFIVHQVFHQQPLLRELRLSGWFSQKNNMVSNFIGNFFQSIMTKFYVNSSDSSKYALKWLFINFLEATASKWNASDAVSSLNEYSLVSDIILYSFQDIFDKIRRIARFKQICLNFIFLSSSLKINRTWERVVRLLQLVQIARTVY